ncbi:glycosyltransferase family 1 protein [SAR202 cluster bacterium AD-493-K16_JPT_193m]|nr:glycosyltransferase family 1 protein [SAR202 cluster bacterium AD-493-K16_JPT_193m]
MRIAFISVHGCPEFQPGTKDAGGMNLYVLKLTSELAKSGYQIDIFTRRHESEEAAVSNIDDNVRLVHIDAGPVDASKEELHDYESEFLAGVDNFQKEDEIRYKLIHSHYWLSGSVGELLASRWQVPHVTTFHTMADIKSRAMGVNDESLSRDAIERKIASEVDCIIASTSDEQRLLMSLYHVDPGKIRVIPIGVDLEMFQPGNKKDARSRLGLGDIDTVLFVGRPDAIKGLEIVLQALTYVSPPTILKLLVIGDNLGYEGFIEDLDLSGMVELIGTRDHQLMPLYYQASDVCIVPSYYESFSMVALEAMACGVPVIASKVGGLQTVVQDGRTGFLVSNQSSREFAIKVDTLLRDRSLRTLFGYQSRQVAEDFGWEGMALAVAETYRELVH